jgi:hypothetical protein
MWKERWKTWIDRLQARLAERRRPSERGDRGRDSDYETIVVGDRNRFDLRRSALPIMLVAIAVVSTAALVPIRRCKASVAARSACASTG